MSGELSVRRAGLADLDVLAPLFGAYRVFYQRESDLAARDFLQARLEQNESVVFLALSGDQALGFTQLYPSFSSVGLGRVWILNDLFVDPAGRGRGVGTALLEAARQFGLETGALRLSLRTEIGNLTAQRVYEAHGWVREEKFYGYDLKL